MSTQTGAPTEPLTPDLRAKIVPPARRQAGLAEELLLHSANAAVIVSKVGQVRSEYRNEARVFAREMAKHVNARQAGNATAFVYEETFGTEDRLHWLIHLRSLDVYYRMVEMGDQDRAYRESLTQERVQTDDGAKAWDRLFVDGSLHSSVLLPCRPTIGTSESDGAEPIAADQTGQAPEEMLHSASAGIVLHRVAQIVPGAGYRARAFAAEQAETVNKQFAGEVTVFRYEEAFGPVGRLHWLLHLRDLTSYRRLLDAPQWHIETTAAELFVPGSVTDTALTPHHWGLYGTKEA
ncbi:MAG TPA: DUF6039 family protein [Micromonosporaceae bacterium]